MIKVRPHVILLDLRDPAVATDVLARPVEAVLIDCVCSQIDGGEEVDDGAVSIDSVVVLDDVDTFADHAEHYGALVENTLGTRFIVLLGSVHGSIADEETLALQIPATLNRSEVRLIWVPYPTGSVWTPGDSRARGVGVNTSNVDDDFGASTVLEAITVPEVFQSLFEQTEGMNFWPFSIGTRQAFFGTMSPEALADACREAGEILAGNRLQDPLVEPPKPWPIPVTISGDSEEFDPIQQDSGFGKFLSDSNKAAEDAAQDLGIGRRRGWYRRSIASPADHIEMVQALGKRYEECVSRVVDLFDSVDPSDGFDIDEFSKLRDEGIDLYPGRDLAADPVKYARDALDPLLNDLRAGHSVASLSAYLRHQIKPIAPRSRVSARDELNGSVDGQLSQRLLESGTTFPDNFMRKLVRSTHRFVDSDIGQWSAKIVIALLGLIAAANWFIGDSSSSGLPVRILGWEYWPVLVMVALGLILTLLFAVSIMVWIVDRQLAHWATSSGVGDIFIALQRLVRSIRKIAVNDWALYRLRTETEVRFEALLAILESSSEKILEVLTGPSKLDFQEKETERGVNQEIRVDFNEGRDVGIYRNFGEVVGILRRDALALIEQAFHLHFDQLKGGERIRNQVGDLIDDDLEQSLTGLVEFTMNEGIIIKTPRKLAGGRKVIDEEGIRRREKLVKDIWADEGIIRDRVAESVLAAPTEALMHFVHPRDLFVIDSSGDHQVDLRFAPMASRPPMADMVPVSPHFANVVFTEQTALAGVLRLVPFRVGTYEYIEK